MNVHHQSSKFLAGIRSLRKTNPLQNTVDGSEWDAKDPCKLIMVNSQYQLVISGFLKHQTVSHQHQPYQQLRFFQLLEQSLLRFHIAGIDFGAFQQTLEHVHQHRAVTCHDLLQVEGLQLLTLRFKGRFQILRRFG